MEAQKSGSAKEGEHYGVGEQMSGNVNECESKEADRKGVVQQMSGNS